MPGNYIRLLTTRTMRNGGRKKHSGAANRNEKAEKEIERKKQAFSLKKISDFTIKIQDHSILWNFKKDLRLNLIKPWIPSTKVLIWK